MKEDQAHSANPGLSYYEVFCGDNFSIRFLIPKEAFLETIFQKYGAGWLCLAVFLSIFDIFFFLFFSYNTNKISKKIEKYKKCLISAKNTEIKHIEEKLKWERLKQGLIKSRNILEEEEGRTLKELEEYMRYVGSYFKMSDIMDNQAALQELFAIFDRFDIEQLTDSSKVERLDVFKVIDKAIDLNFCALQHKEIVIDKQYQWEGRFVISHYSAFFRIIASLLYHSIQASARHSKIVIKTLLEKEHVLVIFQDWGYRIQHDAALEDTNLFKINIVRIQEIAQRYSLMLETTTISGESHMCKLHIPIKYENDKLYPSNVVYLFKR